ncbi:hypothetical protein HPB47_006297, partial [Ixodes persulcatus]
MFSKEVDDALFKLLERERSAGHAVSNRILSEEALRIASQLQLGNFVPSGNWAVEPPGRHEYTLHNKANMDQTMVRMDTAANRTNKLAGASTDRIANTGCARQGFTVALSACTSGHKLPAVCHTERARNGWMTSEKFLEWLERIWGPNLDDVRQLLVLDQEPIHKTQAAKDTPRNATQIWSMCQPAAPVCPSPATSSGTSHSRLVSEGPGRPSCEKKKRLPRKLAKAFPAGRVGFRPRRNRGTFVQRLRYRKRARQSEEGDLHRRPGDETLLIWDFLCGTCKSN